MKKIYISIIFVLLSILNLYSQSVGNFSGALNVNENGDATYSVDIPCPSGINGMQPKISLNYSSQTGQGVAGWGWNIGGLSMITRMPKNYYFDNDKSAVNFEETSEMILSLDGQRLIQYKYILGNRMRADSTFYYVENDKTTQVIHTYNGARRPMHELKVIQKSGIIMEYGMLRDNNYGAEYHIGNYHKSNLGWALTRVYDQYGNFIEYNYDEEYDGYKSRNSKLSKITYGYQEAWDIPQILVGQIDFEYSIRADLNTKQYIGGMEIINTNLLSKIIVKNGANKILETYELEHAQWADKDKLRKVTKRNSANESFNPLTFDYSSYGQYSYTKRPELTFANQPDYLIFKGEVLGDIDGDGLTDILGQFSHTIGDDDRGQDGTWILYKNMGDNKFQPIKESSWRCHEETNFFMLDMDGDGKDELYVGKRDSYGGYYYYTLFCYKYQNGSLVEDFNGRISFETGKALNDQMGVRGADRQRLRVIPADFLGNGKTQFLMLNKENKILQTFGMPSFDRSFFGGNKNAQIFMTDINGNGKPEIAYIDENNTTFYEFNYDSQGKGIFSTIMTSTQFNRKDRISTGDFNGDGNTDLLVRHDRSYDCWRAYYSNGLNSLEEKNMTLFLDITAHTNVLVIDANKDGKTDILYTKSDPKAGTTSGILVSTDGYFYNHVFTPTAYFSYNLHSSNTFNNFNADEIYTHLYQGKGLFAINEGIIYDKLTKVTDGFGQIQNIEYQNFNSTISTGGGLKSGYGQDGSGSAIKSQSAKIQVVKRITGTNIDVSYQFSEPYFHRQGRGFLGFSKITKIDNISGIKYYSEKKINETYKLLYPYKTVQSLNSSGKLISEITQNTTFIDKGNKVYFARLDSEVSKDYLNDKTVTTSYSNYDDSDNARSIKIDYGNSFKEEKTFVWAKVNSEYFNRVKATTLKKSVPGEPDYTITDEFEYDAKGKLVKAISNKNTDKSITTSYLNFDKFGNEGLITITSPNGSRSITKTYTTDGRFVLSKTDHMNKKTTYAYDTTRGLLIFELDELGLVYHQYDNWGRLKKSTYPGNITHQDTMSWAGTGAPTGAKYFIKTMETGKSPITNWFDSLGRLIRTEVYGLNNKIINTDVVYNSLGQVQRETEPYFSGGTVVNAATYTYDEYGRPKTIQTPLGTIQNTYAPLSVTTSSPEGTIITKSNNLGQVISKTINGKEVKHSYHASGLIKKSIPDGGNAIEMQYDILGNRTKISDPTIGTINSEYDGWGQLLKETQNIHKDKPATVTNYVYDTKGLLTSKNRNGETTSYTYDSRNRVTNISINNGYSQSFEYNTLNQIVKKTEKIGTEKSLVTSTEYDTYGRVYKEIYPSGYFIANTYDTNGYLIKITDQNNSLVWQANEGNAKGQITKVSKGNKTTSYTFDAKSQLTNIVADGVISYAYSYDSKGNLSSRKDNLTNQRETFNYDTMNRLLSWSTITTSGSSLYRDVEYYSNTGDIKQIATLNNNLMTYGDRGEPPHALTSIHGIPTDVQLVSSQITYTDSKKLKTITSSLNSFEIFYNADEQRYKSVSKTNGSITETKYYAGNYEEQISGGITKKYHFIYGGNGLAAIYIQNGSTNTLYYAYTDNIGSLVALTDVNGTVKERYMYNPWGVRIDPAKWENRDTRKTLLVNRGYTMHEHLQEFGLINMNGRVYNPNLAIFLSPDPFVQQSGNWLNHNRYTYCLNNPFRYTDPSGEWFGIDDLIVAAAGFVIGYVSHGITTGKWGGEAFLSGLQMAGGAWLGFNTMGASINVYKYMGNMAINGVTSLVVPSFNIPLSDHFGLSLSPALGMGPQGLGGGFSYGLTYSNGNRSIGLSAGVGPNHVSYGMGVKSGDVGLSYYRTHYGNDVGPDGLPNNQVVGGAVLAIGGFSFRIENDVLALAGQQDRWRTNAVEVGIGKYFVFGTTLNTNDPKGEGAGIDGDGALGDMEPYPLGRPSLSGKLNKNGLSSWRNGQAYHSPFYIGVKQGNNVYRIGYSHPKVQDMTQNSVHREGFFHTLLPGISKLLPSSWDFGHQNYYVNYDNFQKGAYFYYGNQQPHSLWGY